MALPRFSSPRHLIKHPYQIREASVLCSKIYNIPRKPLFSTHVKGRVLYLYFKGCCTWQDYISSIDVRLCKVEGDLMTIHNGYYEIYKSHEQDIENAIFFALHKHDISDVVYCGHSAGGALSQISSVFLHEKIQARDIKGHCYTFGAPKAGDKGFIDAVDGGTGRERYVRIENYNDIVPILPIHTSFVHGGLPLILNVHNTISNCQEGNDDSEVETKKEMTVKGVDFYAKYHSNTFDFLQDMRQNDLLNKDDVLTMIDSHKCDAYINGLNHTFFNDKFCSILTDKVFA